jgi:hypothetical protein
MIELFGVVAIFALGAAAMAFAVRHYRTREGKLADLIRRATGATKE